MASASKEGMSPSRASRSQLRDLPPLLPQQRATADSARRQQTRTPHHGTDQSSQRRPSNYPYRCAIAWHNSTLSTPTPWKLWIDCLTDAACTCQMHCVAMQLRSCSNSPRRPQVLENSLVPAAGAASEQWRMCPLHGSHQQAGPATHPAEQPPRSADRGLCCRTGKKRKHMGAQGQQQRAHT
jgi:hypothetical protein